MEKTVSLLSFSLKPLLVNLFRLLIIAQSLYIEPTLNLNKKENGINYDVKLDLAG
jgi:hypothetical protein